MVKKTVEAEVRVTGAKRAEGDLRAVGQAGDKGMAQVVQGAQRATAALRLLGPVLTTLGTGALGVFVKSALDSVNALSDVAQQLGVSTDALQVYQFAAAQAGVTTQELEGALSVLTRKVGEAAGGNKAAIEAFKGLGIGVLDAAGNVRSTEAILADVADAIARVESPAARARIAFDLLGGAGQKLLPVLSGGRDGLRAFEAQARAAGTVLDTGLIDQASEANNALGALGLQARALANTLVALGAPAITAAIGAVNAGIAALRDLLRDAAAGARVLEASLAGNRASAEIERIDRRIAALRALQGQGPSVGSFLGLRPNGAAVEEELAQLQEQRRAAEAAANEANRRFGESLLNRAPSAPGAPATVVPPVATGTRNPVVPGTASAPSAAEQNALLQETLDRLAALAGRPRIPTEDLAEAQRIIEATRTPLETYNLNVERLNTLKASGALDAESYTRALAKEDEALRKASASTDGLEDAAKSLGLTFTSAFEDSIIAGKRFSDVLKSIIADVARLVLRKGVTEPGLNAISGALGLGGGGQKSTEGGGLFGGIGNFISGLFTASAKGNVFANRSVVPFAQGGVFDSPFAFPLSGGRVGVGAEAGPEAIMPLGRDRQGRLGVRAGGGGGGGLVMQNNFDLRGSELSLAQVEARIRAAQNDMIPQLVDAMARNPSLARQVRGR